MRGLFEQISDADSGCIATAAEAFVVKLLHRVDLDHFSCHLLNKLKCQNEVRWRNLIRKSDTAHRTLSEIKYL